MSEEYNSIEAVKEMLECNQKGEVKHTISNYKRIFMHDPKLKNAFRLNMFTDKIDITRDLGWHRESENLTDVDLKYLALYLEENYGLAYEKRIDDVIKIVANENRYHPVRDYLSSLVWDGTERIRYALHHFLGAEVNEYTYEVLKLFMLGTISRVIYPGIKFEGNHDAKGAYTKDFDEIYAGPIFIAEKILLSHEPVYGLEWCLNIHGHDHNGVEAYREGCKHINLAANVCGYMPLNLGKIIKDGVLSDIPSIHRITIDGATMRKKLREEHERLTY